MNIIIDIRCLLEPDYSGVPAYAYNLLQNLLKIDSKNQYYLFYNKSEEHSKIIERTKQIGTLLNYPNVKLADFHYPNKFLNFALRFLKYPKLDKLVEEKIGAKIDVWFSPNPGFINFSKNNSFKFILTIHDLSFERYPEFFASRKNFGINYIRGRFWHKYVGAKKICESADKIIAVSESTKNDLMDIYKIPEDKIRVIHEGVEHHTWRTAPTPTPTLPAGEGDAHSPSLEGVRGRVDGDRFLMQEPNDFSNECPIPDTEIKNKYSLPEKFILFLGTLEPRKNISSIIRAFEKLPDNLSDYHLVIAGKKGWLYDDLFNLAEKSKAKDKIKFIGYVSEEDKPALYKLASLFVFPSFYEGFGLPPLEAMACETPVVTSTAFSLSEVVGDAGILIDPYDVNELAQAMETVLSDEKLRQRMIEKGIKKAETFSWEKAAEESLEVFEGFCKQ